MEHIKDSIQQAVNGDKKALEQVVLHIQDMVYNLALRMLWHPEDAKDASQEILIKVVTNLSTFEHRSNFKTWVYRLASNTLINFRKRRLNQKLSFDAYAEYLNQGLSPTINYTQNTAERKLLVAEAKIGCSNAMLQCLSDASRLVYIVGEILGFNSTEAAIILESTPETFRKKLSRARKKLHQFLNGNCGIVNPNNPCRCHKKVDYAIQKGFINPKQLLFAEDSSAHQLVAVIDNIETEVGLYQCNPTYNAPEDLLEEVKRIISLNL